MGGLICHMAKVDGKTDSNAMAKANVPLVCLDALDSRFNVRTNERTYVDNYLRKISFAYVSIAHEFGRKFDLICGKNG